MGELSDTDDLETYIERFTEQRRKLRELLVHDDGSMVTEDELLERLDEQYGIIVEENEQGELHFTDREFEKRRENAEDGELVETVISRENIPVSTAHMMVITGEHPDDLPPVEERAKSQKEFDEVVGAEFERQLEEQDDPFPLEFPPKDE